MVNWQNYAGKKLSGILDKLAKCIQRQFLQRENYTGILGLPAKVTLPWQVLHRQIRNGKLTRAVAVAIPFAL